MSNNHDEFANGPEQTADSPPASGCCRGTAPVRRSPPHRSRPTSVTRNDDVSDPRGLPHHLNPLCPGRGGDQRDTEGADANAACLESALASTSFFPSAGSG
jgi:hypothetical protein